MAILGYDATEQRGGQLIANVHLDDRPAVIELNARARASRDFDEAITVRARRKDGRSVVLEAHLRTVVDHPALGTGAVVRIRQEGDVEIDAAPTVGRDDRFTSLAAALPTGVLSLDGEGQLVEVNAAAVGLLRRSTADLPNRHLLEDRLSQACARLRRPGRSVTLLFGDLDRFKEINDGRGTTSATRCCVRSRFESSAWCGPATP